MSDLPSPLIDVLSGESFTKEHLPGAVNLCVYETAFLDKVRYAFPDPTVVLTVYGFNDSTDEAKTAVAKLKSAGYQNASALPGGLEGWRAKGGEVLSSGVPDKLATGKFLIDTGSSCVRWTGRNLLNFHTGELRLAGGHVQVKGGKLMKGQFTIDMTSFFCSDLTDMGLNALLIRHLRSDDFFDVENYPQAEFTLSSASFLAGATAGSANYRIRGDLKLRGITNPIQFPALVAEGTEGGFVAQAFLDLDRTLWGSVYGSGKFFARLGRHVVNDLIHLQLKIVTWREESAS
jgi:polyisoprenoid-binding protein YceI